MKPRYSEDKATGNRQQVTEGRCGINSVFAPKTSQVSVEENVRKPINWQRRCWQLGITLGMSGLVALAGNPALAQSNIVPDNTLGAGENSIVIPNFFGLPIEVITGGAQREQNLFHSFTEFNVAVGRQAYFFSGDAAIQNILARVTGINPSEILGVLGTFGSSEPNLFLINPNGIIFGGNAFLDLGGSFVASTADSLLFDNSFEFSASNPQAPPLLTINVPIGLQYGQNPGSIAANQALLLVQPERTLALVGGEVTVDSGILFVPDGRIELGSVAGNNRVNLTSTDTGYILDYESVEDFQDIRLSQAGVITSGDGGGSIQVQGREVTLSDETFMFADTLGSENGGGILLKAEQLTLEDGAQVSVNTFAQGEGGNLIVNASESVRLIGISADSQFESGLFTQSEGSGKAGNVEITTAELLVADGAVVSTVTFNKGEGGSLIVNASESVQVIGTSADGQFVSGLLAQTEGSGKAGNVEITTAELLIADGAVVSAGTFGEGEGGSLMLNASESVQVIGTSADGQFVSGLLAQTEGSGKAGNVEITTTELLVVDGAQVSVGTLTQGEGGSLIINASESVQVIGTSADGQSSSSLLTQSGGSGKAGNLEITTANLLVADGAKASGSTFAQGGGGSLIINASESVQLIGTSADGQIASGLFTQTQGSGKVENLEITTVDLLVADGARVSAGTFGEGEGGSLIIDASESVQLIGTSANGQIASSLDTQTQGSGKAGNLEITTVDLLVADGARVSAGTSGEGEGGSLIIDASESVQLIGTSADGQIASGLGTQTQGLGKAGNLEITTTQLLVTDGAGVNAGTSGEGEGGSLIVNASESVQLIGTSANGQIPSSLFALSLGSGKAGNLEITTTQLLVTDGAKVDISTFREGEGGSLIINASESVQLMGTSADGQFSSGLFALSEGSGKAGNLEITTVELLVANGGQVSAETFAQGKGGNLIIDASESVQVIGTTADGRFASGLLAGSFGSGKAGNLEIYTPELLVANGAQVSAGTFGEGEGGSLIVDVSESVRVIGISPNGQFASGLFTSSEGSGKAGNLEITTSELLVANGAQVNAGTFGEGEGGSLIVNASESVEVIGESGDGRAPSGLFAQSFGSGNAGNLEIDTAHLLVTDGAQVSASTFGEGKGGSLIINASESVQVIGESADGQLPSSLSAESQGLGKAGNLEIDTAQLLVADGAQVSAATLYKGEGGDLFINASESVQVIGTSADGQSPSSLLASSEGTGNAGDLRIITGEMSIQEGAQVTVSSPQAQAGNLNITADFLLLNQGTISAETAKSGSDPQGSANITLNVSDSLLMRNESLISATALDQANGGNIIINTPFLIALPPEGPEGSDITANAFQGDGGRVNINAIGIFGIQFRDRLTPFNDITVSSEFGSAGVADINTSFDVTRGLVTLPTDFVDATQLIDRRCTPNDPSRQSSFYITGRGGIRQNPTEMLDADATVSDWVTLDTEEELSENTDNNTNPTSTKPQQIIEAQGIIRTPDGQLYLAAEVATVTPHGEWIPAVDCNNFRK
ncbi:MAG: filamentous hemagglutinin N-terminal domain-containing protein [Symploca sp. SIO2C1]|nr:filamentous hemagglutinin N-terminal domain-containing protein [Symploca sp. SIO2C1]